MAAFLQDLNSADFVLVGGNLVLAPTLQVEVAQAIRNTLTLWQGEWFLDTKKGVPFFAQVLGQKDVRAATQVLQAAVKAVPGVASIASLTSSFDQRTRKLSIAFQVIATDGSTVSGSLTQ